MRHAGHTCRIMSSTAYNKTHWPKLVITPPHCNQFRDKRCFVSKTHLKLSPRFLVTPVVYPNFSSSSSSSSSSSLHTSACLPKKKHMIHLWMLFPLQELAQSTHPHLAITQAIGCGIDSTRRQLTIIGGQETSHETRGVKPMERLKSVWALLVPRIFWGSPSKNMYLYIYI